MKEDQTRNSAAFSPNADDVFGRIASRYGILCDLFSFGIHRLWKQAVAREICSHAWNLLLDGATGTGDILLRVLARDRITKRQIIASDISIPMLAIAADRIGTRNSQVRFETLDLEQMPTVQSASVDAYSISLGLKICNRQKAVREALRVLRPGGRLVVLEASNIPIGWMHKAYLSYIHLFMPVVGWLATGGDSSAYRYLLDGVVEFPTAEVFARELEEAGFERVRYRRLSFGIVAIHVAVKPGESL